MQETSLIAQLVKNPPAIQETPIRSLGWEDPLEKGKATHSSILAWSIVHGVAKSCHMTEQLSHTHTSVQSLGQGDPLEGEMATHASIHVWKTPWTEKPGGL